ncbi:phage protein [Streptococcus pneumoniae]|nr:phage protein [Streptococcus pneumoniae]
MGVLELIKQFEEEFYPISEEKKSLLIKQPLSTVITCLSDMASWKACGSKVSW